MSNFLTVAEASRMTRVYRENRDTILLPAFQGKDILPVCETIERHFIETLLSRQGCSKIRIYLGMDEQMQVHAILVGVNENDEDILPASASADDPATGDDELIVDNGTRCPPICPPKSDLNE